MKKNVNNWSLPYDKCYHFASGIGIDTRARGARPPIRAGIRHGVSAKPLKNFGGR